MNFIRKFWDNGGFVLTVFLIWRFGLLVIGWWSVKILPFKASFPYIDEVLIASGLPQWLWQWGNFDGVHYLRIAASGYHGGDQTFFPLFPVVIRGLSYFLPNYFWAGFLAANLTAFLAALALYFLVKRDWGVSAARWAVVFLLAFPSAFFFGAIYTEGVFLLLVLLAFSFQRVGRLVFSLLAGLTRLTGSLIPPFFGAAGLGLYMGYLQINFSQPLYFLTAQASFKNARASDLFSLVSPPQVIFRYLKIFATADWSQWAFRVAMIELAAFLFGLGVLTFLSIKKRLPARYLVFSWAALLLPVFSGTLSSMPRYLLPIFPIYLFLAGIKNSFLKLIIIGAFLLWQAILACWFLRGYFVA
jgi:hypothetical protein